MASIDKIYGTKAQYDEFYQWCQENKPDAVRYFYDWDWEDELVHPITNFPSEVDYWMFFSCPIQWVIDRIKSQYGIDDNDKNLEIS